LMRSDNTEVLRNRGYVRMMVEALGVDQIDPPVDLDTFYLALSTGLSEQAGFFLQYDI